MARWRRLQEWRRGDKMARVGDGGGGVAAQERKDANWRLLASNRLQISFS